MKALVQRVSEARVEVRGDLVSRIGKGLLVFLGIERGDADHDLDYLVKKVSQMRIFEDSEKKMNHSVKDISGDVLVISQFTLTADCRKGNRPSFDCAEDPPKAKEMYDQFVHRLRNIGITVKTGYFGFHMKVHIVNDGPVTILLDSRK